MIKSSDFIKTLAGRFVSLSPQARIKIAERLLRWRNENLAPEVRGKSRSLCAAAPAKSFVEIFWEEVEAAHGDGLYPFNPFAA